jgi:hypothetical protein
MSGPAIFLPSSSLQSATDEKISVNTWASLAVLVTSVSSSPSFSLLIMKTTHNRIMMDSR